MKIFNVIKGHNNLLHNNQLESYNGCPKKSGTQIKIDITQN